MSRLAIKIPKGWFRLEPGSQICNGDMWLLCRKRWALSSGAQNGKVLKKGGLTYIRRKYPESLINSMLKAFKDLGNDPMARIDARKFYEYFKRKIDKLCAKHLQLVVREYNEQHNALSSTAGQDYERKKHSAIPLNLIKTETTRYMAHDGQERAVMLWLDWIAIIELIERKLQ